MYEGMSTASPARLLPILDPQLRIRGGKEMNCLNDIQEDSGAVTTAVVLAGGRASRFGELGALLPKSLYVISDRDTILSRLLDQLADAKIAQVVISTNPSIAPLLTEFVRRYIDVRLQARNWSPGISVISNDEHRVGPIAALSRIFHQFTSQRYLLCLGDVIFARNPMPALMKHHLGNLEMVALTSKHRRQRGGVVIEEPKGRVTLFSHVPLPARPGSRMSNWTGTALLSFKVAKLCKLIAVQIPPSAPLETLLQYLVESDIACRLVRAGSFFNLNTYNDWLACQRQLSKETNLNGLA